MKNPIIMHVFIRLVVTGIVTINPLIITLIALLILKLAHSYLQAYTQHILYMFVLHYTVQCICNGRIYLSSHNLLCSNKRCQQQKKKANIGH